MSFNEKTLEWSSKQGCEIPVWKSDKYESSKATALKIIEKYEAVKPSDFWILMTETKTGKMAYNGLIISHNGCLKLNQELPESERFKPSCLTLDKDGFKDSLVYTYCNDSQGIYEVGEVSKENCKNAYPYAMALKRCFDRVVLKITKLAFDDIYSDSEADEFKEPQIFESNERISKDHITTLINAATDVGSKMEDICKYYKVDKAADMTETQYVECIAMLMTKKDKQDEIKNAEQ